MRITNVFSGRPSPADRGPLQKQFGYNNVGVANHGATTRWTYTVPTARKFIGGPMQAGHMQQVVGGVANISDAGIYTIPSGGANLALINSHKLNGAVDAKVQLIGAPGLLLYAGDLIQAITSDTSTGGQQDYNVNMVGTEYDA